MSICLTIISVYFYFKLVADVSSYGTVPVISLASFILVFSIGFGPIPWMMMGEIFPAKVKGIASSISASFNWTLAFVVTKLFPSLLDSIGACYTFGLAAVICLFGTIFVYYMVPETKGKSADEIKLLLMGDRPKKDLQI